MKFLVGYSEYLASVSMSLSEEKFTQYKNSTGIQNELNKITTPIPSMNDLKIDLLAFRKKVFSNDIVCFVSKRSDLNLEDFKKYTQLLFGIGLEYAKDIRKHRLVVLDFATDTVFPKEIIEFVQDETALKNTLFRAFTSYTYVGFPILAELSSPNVYYCQKHPFLGRHLYSVGAKYAKDYFRP